MKIAFLIQDITTNGGTERTTCCLANIFAQHGHDVSVVSVFNECNAPHYKVDDKVKLSYLASEKYHLGLGMARRLARVVRQLPRVKACRALIEADVIIGQRLLASVLLWMAGWSGKSVVCEHLKYAMYTPFVRRIRNIMYKRFTVLVALTENDREKYSRSLSRVEVIPNMVSLTPLPYQGLNTKRVIAVGRLEKQKGFDLLLQALPKVFARFPDWRLDIFGNGSEEAALIEQRDTLGLTDFVTFKGYTSNIERQYATSAFFVLSSRFEGFPMAILEAAACGLPIVSFDCPEGPGVLLKGGNGLLVPAENVPELTKAIEKMMEDDAMRAAFSRQSLEVVKLYAPENIYHRWMELFRKYNMNGQTNSK